MAHHTLMWIEGAPKYGTDDDQVVCDFFDKYITCKIGLNAVTTPDSFPLPRIDDLLERLGESKYFSTIDLASGFWQIRVHPSSQPKTAFVV